MSDIKNTNQIDSEVEKTLNALNEMDVLQPNPFLFSRIKDAAFADEVSPVKTAVFSLNPIVISLIIVINIFTAVFFINHFSSSGYSNETIAKSLNNEYKLNNYYNEYYKIQSYELE